MDSTAPKSSSDKNLKFLSRSSPIGFFDSGIGGMSLARAFHQLHPQENIIYYADQAHFPFGEKTPDQLLSYCLEAADFLMQKEIKLLVIACNTATAYCLEALQQKLSIPVMGMLKPALSLLEGCKTVLLIGSHAMVASNIYQKRISHEKPSIRIVSKPCQRLIQAIEKEDPEVDRFAEEALKNIVYDELLLGCTHFTLIRPVLQKIAGSGTPILDPVPQAAKEISQFLQNTSLLSDSTDPGHLDFFTSQNL